MDFYCFLNFFTPKLYRFPHKKLDGSEKEPVGVTWQLELLVSEKLSKQL